MHTDILVVGAGAAGLAAAYELSLVGKKVTVLEARNRLGGRIYTINDQRFSQPVEAGAEFIHGKLPYTLKLLEKANIKHHPTGGKIWRIHDGRIEKSADFIEDWHKLMGQLKELQKDIPITDFLEQYFPGEKNREMKESVLQFVQGYDAADATKASSFALREEWENEDDNQQRIDNGYLELMNYLANECKKRGNTILLSESVKTIYWEKRKVKLVTTQDTEFAATKVLITIPLGVWQAEAEEGHISFIPELIEKKQAAQKMGFGAVIKVNLQFKNQFWEEDEITHPMKNAGFIFSDAEIPTWWTQHPNKNAMLTGWLAGPKAFELRHSGEEKMLEKTMQTLSYVFGMPANFIQEKLVAYYIANWTADPYSRGAYSYATLDTHWAKKILSAPIEETLYFAGEALYEGTENGTVEGAIASGIAVARQIVAQA